MAGNWVCQSCGAMFPAIVGDGDTKRCSKCVIVEEQDKRIAELELALKRIAQWQCEQPPTEDVVNIAITARAALKLGTGGGE